MRGIAGTPQRVRFVGRRLSVALAVAVLALTVSAPALAAADPDPAGPAPPITCEPVGVFGPGAQICEPAPPDGDRFTAPEPREPSDTGHPVPDYSPPDRGFTPAPDLSSEPGFTPAPVVPSDTGNPAPEEGAGPVIDAAGAGKGLTGEALERYVADLLGDRVIDRNREIERGGEVIGEVDIETEAAIIEATSSSSGKVKQIENLITNQDLNPDDKPVILYTPNYTRAAGQDVEQRGGLVARTDEELLGLLEGLDGGE